MSLGNDLMNLDSQPAVSGQNLRDSSLLVGLMWFNHHFRLASPRSNATRNKGVLVGFHCAPRKRVSGKQEPRQHKKGQAV